MVGHALRPARAKDSAALYALHRAALGPYIEAIYGPWDEEVQTIFHSKWFDPDRLQVIEMAGDLAGVLDYTMSERLRVDRIAIHPAYQDQGIGTAVMTALLEEADKRNLAATLEVFDINPARRLYERLGFVEVKRDGPKVHMRREALR